MIPALASHSPIKQMSETRSSDTVLPQNTSFQLTVALSRVSLGCAGNTRANRLPLVAAAASS